MRREEEEEGRRESRVDGEKTKRKRDKSQRGTRKDGNNHDGA